MPVTAAVALVSGGLDSCVALAEAVARHGPGRVAGLHVTYGQRTQQREREAFEAIAGHYDLEPRLVALLSHLGQMGGSSLTDPSRPIPVGDGGCGSVPSTYVPFRNASLLAAGVVWAEVLGAGEVYCGAHGPGSAYPDTRPAFFEAFNRLVEVGTAAGTEIRVLAPLLQLDKAAIVRHGFALEAPLHLTWSCYARQDRPCGSCHSCRLRAEGFAGAGHPDPLRATERLC